MTHPAPLPAGDAARSLDLLLREHIWNDHPRLVLGGEKFAPIGAEEIPGYEAAEHAVLLRRQSDGQVFEACIDVTIRPARSGETGNRDYAGQQAREGITGMGWDNLGSGGCVQ